MRTLAWFGLAFHLVAQSGCQLLWNPYITTVLEGGCDQDCASGGNDAAIDQAADSDAAVATGCQTPYPWNPLTSPGFGMLTGVTGDGVGIVWIGSPTFRGATKVGGTMFQSLGGATETSSGRMIYAAGSGLAFQVINGVGIARLSSTTAGVGTVPLANGEAIAGLSSDPLSNTGPYLAGNAGTFLIWQDLTQMWQGAAQAPGALVGVSVATPPTPGSAVAWALERSAVHLYNQGGWGASVSTNGFNGLTAVWEDGTGTARAVGAMGTIVDMSAAGGLSLTEETSGVTTNLWDIGGTHDGTQLWTVGELGTILHRSPQCPQWTAEQSGTKSTLRALWVDDRQHRVWVVGDSGTVLYRSF